LLAMPVVAQAQNQRPPRLTTVTEERYRLQPGDVLEVQFRYSPEFNQTITVQPDGYISLEISGDIKVAGMTVEQARNAILSRRTSDLENDLTLQAGDMVFVPRDKISKIERFMKLASVAAFMAPRL